MSEVTVRFRGDTRQLERALANVNRGLDRVERNAKQSNRALRSISATGDRVTGVLRAAGAALVAFGTTRAIGGILQATETMEGFRTQLTTYLGSQELANAELARLSKLARTLPQDVNQLTEAFVIFNRFGLDTSNESMRAFSNIAAANSKSITQLGEAVADALTGEFERLKEFGIKVSKENGQFTARIGEDQVAVATSTKELVEQLKALGAEGGRFGNVTIGPLTLAMSNFRGAVFEASAALGQGGFGLAVADAVNAITDMLTKNDELITAIGDGLTKAFLFAKEGAIFLYQNIEVLGKIMAVVIGISMARWAIATGTAMAGLAVTVGGHLVKAFGFLGKVLRATALLALRHPLIGAVAVVIGGIEYLTGAVSGLAEKFGLIGDDSALDKLVGEAGELADTITGPIVKGIEDFSSISDRVNEQFDSIKVRATETNKQLSEQAAQQEVIKKQAEAANEAERSRAKQVQEILDAKYEELRVSGLSLDEQKLINLEKEIEKKIGKDINDTERENLRLLIQQQKEEDKKNKLKERSKAIALDTLTATFSAMLDEQEAINGVNEQLEKKNGLLSNYVGVYRDHLGEIFDLEKIQQAEIGQLRIDNIKKIDNKIRQIEERRIRDLLAMNKTGIAQTLSEYDKGVLQRIGQEERQQKIVNDRIEFEKKSEFEKYQFAVEQGANAFEQLGKFNKQAFQASKALRIAEAIMNTYTGATLALATYPPPFNFIGAAAVVAAGLANIATIRSQQYTGRQLGGAVTQDESYIVGETGPEIFTPSTSGRIDRMDSLGGTPVEITFNINAVDTQGFDELLVSRRGVIQQVISDAMLESGQRSRF